ncbi:MAG: glycosyltransferase family 2 protein [Aquaticitalea sp.]
MKVLVIVVTYNGSKWIDKCFGSLIKSTIPMQILAVDNNSSDDTAELIKNKYPQVNFYETGKNLGFGKANNVGLKMALEQKFEYILLLNQDAWVENDTIENLINKQKEKQEYGVVVPLQLNGSGNLIDSMFMEFTIANNRELITKVFKGSEGLHQVNFANAACWLMPISTIEKVGGFDPLFPHYGEDDDFLNRMKKQGLKVGLDLETTVFHDREHRKPKTTLKEVVNESYTRELIALKNPFVKIKSKGEMLRDILKSGIKFITSAFNRYYIYKMIAYFRLFKIYDSILDHRKEETRSFHHYL